jgi:hypothetical protein
MRGTSIAENDDRRQSPGVNGLAIFSLVLGILWGFGLLSLLALVFGMVALGQIRRRGQGGSGLAVAGIVLGAIGLVGLLFLLAVVGVFAVGGVGDKGGRAECTIDTRTLRTAEEAYVAAKGNYGDETSLVSAGFLSEPSDLHHVRATSDGSLVVVVTDSQCGSVGNLVGQTADDN